MAPHGAGTRQPETLPLYNGNNMGPTTLQRLLRCSVQGVCTKESAGPLTRNWDTGWPKLRRTRRAIIMFRTYIHTSISKTYQVQHHCFNTKPLPNCLFPLKLKKKNDSDLLVGLYFSPGTVRERVGTIVYHVPFHSRLRTAVL